MLSASVMPHGDAPRQQGARGVEEDADLIAPVPAHGRGVAVADWTPCIREDADVVSGVDAAPGDLDDPMTLLVVCGAAAPSRSPRGPSQVLAAGPGTARG